MAKRRAAIYLRVSTKEQVEGYSLDSQKYRCVAKAREMGLDVGGRIYVDEGESAAYDSPRKRLYFKAMLEDAKSGQFDTLIIDKVDRFARNLPKATRWLEILQDAGVVLVSVSENIDPVSPTGELTLHFLLAISHWFSRNLSDEVKKGQDGRARKGLWRGDPPFGYCRGNCDACSDPNGERCPRYGGEPLGSGDKLVVHPTEAAGVKLLFEYYAYEATSFRDAAAALNGAGYLAKSKRRPPGPFYPASVRVMLRNPSYIGKVRLRDRKTGIVTLVPAQHTPLIKEDLWEAVQEKMVRLSNGPRRLGKGTRGYPISGVGYCARCGARLYGSKAGGYCYYYCSRRHQYGPDVENGGCDLPWMRAEHCESAVADLLASIELPGDWRERVLKSAETPRQSGPTLETIAEQQKRLTWMFQEGFIDQQEFQKRWAGIEAKRQKARPPTRLKILQAGELLENLGRLWGESTDRQAQGALLDKLFESIHFEVKDKSPSIRSARPNLEFLDTGASCPFFGRYKLGQK